MLRKNTRWLSLLLALAMVVCTLPVLSLTAKATSDWIGFADTAWYMQNSSAESFTISTAAELAGLSMLVKNGMNTFSGKTITLTADIDLSGYNWVPIDNADSGFRFAGTFDGAKYSITNMTVDLGKSDYAGLFGGIQKGSIVQNVSVSGSVSGDDDVGGIVGRSYGTVQNCCYVNGSVSGDDDVGGIVGENDYGTVQNCYVNGSVSGDDDVGGIVGDSYGISLINCYFNGEVTGNNNVGGIGGHIYSKCDDVIIENCYVSGSVNCSDEELDCPYIGSIVGKLDVYGYTITIENCYYLKNCVSTYDETYDKAIGYLGYHSKKAYTNDLATDTTSMPESQMKAAVGKTNGSDWAEITVGDYNGEKIALVDTLNAWVALPENLSENYYTWEILESGYPVLYPVPACVKNESTVPTDGLLKIFINSVNLGEYTFTDTDKGWTIQNELGKYLTVANGRLYTSDAADYWQWNGNSLSLQKEVKVKTGTPHRENVTYYLSNQNGKIAVSTTSTKTTFTHMVEYYEHDYRNHICSRCGAHEKGWENLIVTAKVSRIKLINTYNKVSLTTTGYNGVTVSKVEYSTNGLAWRTGKSFTFKSATGVFWVRVTDTAGTEYYFYYDGYQLDLCELGD